MTRWKATEMPMCILQVEHAPNRVLVKQLILALTRSPEDYERPRVVGEMVVNGAEVVIAARRLGWKVIEVRKRYERPRSTYDGPPVRPVWILEEVVPLAELLRERLNEMLNGDGGPEVKTARAVELAIVRTLMEWGFPGEPIAVALRDELSLPGSVPGSYTHEDGIGTTAACAGAGESLENIVGGEIHEQRRSREH